MAVDPRAFLFLVLVCAGATAQDSEKAATALLKARSSQALAQLKQDLAGHVAALDAQLELMRNAIEGGAFDTGFVEALADDLRDEQAAAYADIGSVSVVLADGTSEAIALLPVATPDGEYPADFYVGANGIVAQACRTARKVVEKAYAGLAKRAAKVEAIARKHGLGLTIQFLPPDPQNPSSAGNEGGFNQFPQLVPEILVLLAWSDLDVPADGRVLICGMPPFTLGGFVDVVIQNLQAPGIVSANTSVPIVLGDPFHVIMDGFGSLLGEGNWIVKLQADGVPTSFAAFGIP